MTMTILFNITASRGTRQTFCVPAVEVDRVGHYVNGKPYRPDMKALRRALPAQWRKAFDRARGMFWFDNSDPSKPAYCTLHFPNADSVTLVARVQA